MSNTDLDKQLQEYLAEKAKEKRDGHTLANIRQILVSQSESIQRLEEAVDHHDQRLDRHGREIRSLKSIVNYDGEMDTGQHQIDVVKHAVERMQIEADAERKAKIENVVWWKRQIVTWIAAAVGVVLLQILAAVITLALANAQPGKK